MGILNKLGWNILTNIIFVFPLILANSISQCTLFSNEMQAKIKQNFYSKLGRLGFVIAQKLGHNYLYQWSVSSEHKNQSLFCCGFSEVFVKMLIWSMLVSMVR